MSTALILVCIPVALAFIVASLRDPLKIALPAYAVTVPFGSGIPVLGAGFGSLSSLLGVVVGLGMLVQLMTVRRGSVRLPATVAAWLALLALTGTTVIWSLDPALTAKGFLSFASLVLLFVLAALIRFDGTELRRFENALLLGGVASAGYGLLQLLVLGGFPLSAQGSSRFGNDLLGPNNQAAALLLPFALAVGRVAVSGGIKRLAYLAATSIIVVGVVMTGSRGGLVSMAAAFIVVTIATHQGRRLLLGYGLAGLVLLTGLLVVHPAGVGERVVNHSTASGRFEIWSIGLYACKTYCFGGAGWETFPSVYELYQPDVPDARVLVNGTSYQAHNIWVLAAIELGVLGLVLLVLALGLSVTGAMRLPRFVRGPPLGAVVGTVCSGFFLSNLEFKFWWMALIYAVVCQNYYASREDMAITSEPVDAASMAAS